MSWSQDVLNRFQSAAGDLEIVIDHAKSPASSLTNQSLRLHGPRNIRRLRRHTLRERNQTKYPSSRWQSLPETKKSDVMVQQPCSLSDFSRRSIRRPMPPSRDGMHMAMKMPVRQDSFRLRPKLSHVGLSSPLIGSKLTGQSTVDMISQVLQDLDLIDDDEDDTSVAGEECWTV